MFAVRKSWIEVLHIYVQSASYIPNMTLDTKVNLLEHRMPVTVTVFTVQSRSMYQITYTHSTTIVLSAIDLILWSAVGLIDLACWPITIQTIFSYSKVKAVFCIITFSISVFSLGSLLLVLPNFQCVPWYAEEKKMTAIMLTQKPVFVWKVHVHCNQEV